jgi:hypothetical protein
MWGGKKPDSSAPVYIQTPAPAAPSATQTAEDYAKALPIYYQTALEYQPKMAAMEKSINEQLYPQTAGLQEIVAGQAQEGLTQPIGDWYRQNVADTLKSQLGRNLVYNPQAQEDYGIATQQAYQDWQNYYRNLGLSWAGRQPLAASPNLMSSYTPALQTQANQSSFGTQAGIYGHGLNYNTNMYNTNLGYSNPWANIGGSLAGGLGSGLGTLGGMMGYGFGSKRGWW